MAVPDEFKIVCRRIVQDAADLFPSTEAIASFAVAPLDDKQSKALRAYLDGGPGLILIGTAFHLPRETQR
jgi:hypothetical protein